MRVVKKVKSELSLNIDSEKYLGVSKINLHNSIGFFLVIAQFFGVMPLHHIRNDCHHVDFKWKSFRVFYSVVNAVGAFVSASFWIAKFCKDGLYVHQTSHVCFYTCTCLGSLILIQIARHWSEILRDWSYVELAMRHYSCPMDLKKRFVHIISFFFGLGLVEHLLFIVNGVWAAYQCVDYSDDMVEKFFEISFQNFYAFINFSYWSAFLIKFSNTISTFTWIFTDLLIALISIALTAKFRQIVRRLEDTKVTHEKFWKEIRQDYQRLYNLCQKMQQHFSALILVSYIQNIFFLCIQLYNSLRDRKGIIESVYFFYSFAFLVLRLVAVSLYGAWLHDEARKPLEFLHSIPTEHYCTDVSRLIEQIYTTPIGISGSGFFLVTKNFLLQMAGTIVTFELMIFQFAPVKYIQHSSEYDNC